MHEEIRDVAIEDTASAAEVEALEAVFRRHGLDVEIVPDVVRVSNRLLPWVIYITLVAPVASFFTAFGSAIGTEAGQDAYRAVKRWVMDVFEARRDSGNGQGSIVLRDLDHTNLVLHTAYPDEALDALRKVDWDELRGGYLVWDEQRRVWRDVWEEERR
jgi:hypothetical protein